MAGPDQGCNVKFNGLDGKYGKSASLWLAYLKQHRETGSTPSLYLQHIDDHLEGKAAKWVLDTPNVSALICKGYVGLATESDVDAFHGALSDHFKFTPSEKARNVDFATMAARLTKLKQGSGEGLEQYFIRVWLFLIAQRGRDGENDALTPLEVSLRVLVVSGFVAGLSCKKLRHRLQQQQIYHSTVSLRQAFKMAEAEMKIMKLEKRAEVRNEENEQNEKSKLQKQIHAATKRQLRTVKKQARNEDSKHEKHKLTAAKPQLDTVQEQAEKGGSKYQKHKPTATKPQLHTIKKQVGNEHSKHQTQNLTTAATKPQQQFHTANKHAGKHHSKRKLATIENRPDHANKKQKR